MALKEECGCCTGGDVVGECKEIKFVKSNNSPFEFEHQSHDHWRSHASRAAVLLAPRFCGSPSKKVQLDGW